MKKTLISAVTVGVAATAAAGALWAGALAPRQGHPGWEAFSHHRYAHRGLHNMDEGRPENSFSAFRAAVEHGFGAELDLHLMADGNLAVVHDSDLERVCGRSAIIEELTAADLNDYPLLGSGETIPLFEDVLALFEGKTPLIVELKTSKGNAARLTDAAMEQLAKWNGLYCVESFDPAVLLHLKKHYPAVIRGQLSCDFLTGNHTGRGTLADFAMTNLLTTFLTKPDFIAYKHQDRGVLSLRLMKKLYGVHEVSWTVREAEVMETLENEGVPAIFEGFLP